MQTQSAITTTVTNIICKAKGIKRQKLPQTTSMRALGMDQLDLVNVILAVEQQYCIIIPDEVPVETVADLVQYVYTHIAA